MGVGVGVGVGVEEVGITGAGTSGTCVKNVLITELVNPMTTMLNKHASTSQKNKHLRFRFFFSLFSLSLMRVHNRSKQKTLKNYPTDDFMIIEHQETK